MDYDKVPEGWGRSVVNGREILTQPSREASAGYRLANDHVARTREGDYRSRMSDQEAIQRRAEILRSITAGGVFSTQDINRLNKIDMKVTMPEINLYGDEE